VADLAAWPAAAAGPAAGGAGSVARPSPGAPAAAAEAPIESPPVPLSEALSAAEQERIRPVSVLERPLGEAAPAGAEKEVEKFAGPEPPAASVARAELARLLDAARRAGVSRPNPEQALPAQRPAGSQEPGGGPAWGVSPPPVRPPDPGLGARSSPVDPTPAAAAERVDRVERLVEMGQLRSSGGSSRVELLVHPDSFGRVAVRLLERGGLIEVAVRSDSPRLQALLGEGLPSLVAGLEDRAWQVRGLEQGEGAMPDWFAGREQGRQGSQDRRGSPERRQQDPEEGFSLEPALENGGQLQ